MTRLTRMYAGVALSALGAGLIATPSWAQEQTPAASGDRSVTQSPSANSDQSNGDIVVTGSLIRRPDLKSNSPVTYVNAQEIRYQGATTTDQILARLPQFTADEDEYQSNGSDGTANVNLRGLGSNRTLVLIDGQRMMSSQAIDLDFVPSLLIKRVDVVTGGASAVYGSDALSGVVNFILDNDLNGLRVDAQSGFAQHDNSNSYLRGLQSSQGYPNAPSTTVDGGKYIFNVAAGRNFDDGRGNITAYGSYRHADPVAQDSRDYSACALNQVDSATTPGVGFACGGSSNTPYGTFAPLSGPNANSGYYSNAKDGSKTFVPYDSSFAYNYTPTNYIQRADDRYTAGAFVHFKVTPAVEPYGSFMFMRDDSVSHAAPSALFLGTTFNVPCNNPLLSASQATFLCGASAGTSANAQTLIGYRLAEFPRTGILEHNDFRYTGGIRGNFGKDSAFHYDVNYLYALTRYDYSYLNDVSPVKAQNALDVVNVGGVPTCQSVIDGSDPACVPANVFQANGVTSAQANYLFAVPRTFTRNTLQVISGTVGGDLGKFGIRSPFSDQGVAFAIGAEHRRETLLFTANDVAVEEGTAPADGQIRVTEGYGELQVPLVSDVPFIQSLSLDGGARYSSYHNSQTSTGLSSDYKAWTYKGELSWEPVRDIRFRASYNRAIRAPNVTELFASQTLGNVALDDPCAGATPTYSEAVCARTGVTPAQYGHVLQCPADNCSALSGGNPAVKPEKGDTYTIGLVLTPQQIRRLSLSVDYYHIKVSQYIGTVDPSLAVSQCISTGDPFYCGLFHRDPRSGAIYGAKLGDGGYITTTTYNTGYVQTSGLDFTGDYTVPVGRLGKLNANMVGTLQLHQITEPLPGLGTYDCKGLYGVSCGQPNPAWRHVARLTWTIPNETAAVSLAWRYIGGTKLSTLSDNPALTGTGSAINARIPAYNYFDLTVTAHVKQLDLRAGVTNIADKNPPAIATSILSTFSNGNTYPGVYDPLGRVVFVGATLNY